MPDPLDLLDDELASADTEAMRTTAELVWGTTETPSPVTTQITQAADQITHRFHTGISGRWEGDSYHQFVKAIDRDRAAIRLALRHSTVIGDASVRAADAIESAYTDAMTTCLDASVQVAALAAGRGVDEQRTDRAITKVIQRTLEAVVKHCRTARRDLADLTPKLKAITDESASGEADEPARPMWVDKVTGWQPTGDDNSPVPSGRLYTVEEGDTLWDIAARLLGDPTRWPEIYALNTDRITDPHLIHPGQQLQLPTDHADGGAAGPETPPGRTTEPHPPPPSQPPDGGEPRPPARSPEPPPTDTTPAPAAPSQPDDTASGREPVSPHLPSGSWVAIGLAAAVLAAWALARLRRHPRTQTRHNPNLDLPPEPRLVTNLRKLLGPQADEHLPADPRYGAPIPPLTNTPTRGTNVAEVARGGLGLTGPGTASAARAAIAGMLCAGGPLIPAQQGTVLTIDATLTALLDNPDHDHLPGPLPRLIVLRDIDEITQWVQVEVVRRRRVLGEHGAATADELPRVDPYAVPLAPVLAIVPAPPPHRLHALKALLDEAAPLGISALLLGDWPTAGIFVDGDGHTTTSQTSTVRPGRISTLDPADLRDALQVATVAAESPHTASDDDLLLARLPDDVHPPTSPTVVDAQPASPPQLTPAADFTDKPDKAVAPSTEDDTAATGNESQSHDAPSKDRGQPDTDAEAPAVRPDAGTPAPAADPEPRLTDKLVKLQVLGPVKLATQDVPITQGLRSDSLALLVLLAAHPGGRTMEQIIDALDDPTDPGAPGRCRTAVTALRRLLRRVTGDHDRTHQFVVRDNGVYRIDPDLFDIDLWRLRSAIDAADHATDDAAQLSHLREAAAAYAGPLGEGDDRPWVEEHAPRLRDDALDVYDRITEITEADRPELAVAALRAAIGHDPTGEYRYQTLMRILGRLQRPDAVRQVLSLCYTNLAAIGTEPSPVTLRVASRQLR